MPGPVFLEGNLVELRTIEHEDADFLQRLINDPRVRPRLLATDPVSLRAERDWIGGLDDGDGIHFLVAADGDPVGSIDIKPPIEPWGTAEVGYSIAPAHWGSGYATAALDLVCQYAFEERRLEKLYAVPLATNPASCRVLEKVGFEEEGRLRKEAFVDGERVDVCRYGLLAEEWRPS